jgi:NAD(P)-dependent dehydrogenase (short-subunit alcohol dehydrogenase family)
MRFEGKRALVTGAASGIGEATARLLAREGAEIVRVDRKPIDGIADTIVGDVADEALWDRAAARLAPLDLAVVNAGVAGSGKIAQLDFAEWRRILSTNLDGAFLSLRAALRAMDDGGSIVLVSSAAAIRPTASTAAYGSSKAAMIHLARIAAKENIARGIRVNVVAPGRVATPIWHGVPSFAEMAAQGGEAAAFAAFAAGADETPLDRFATADEVAAQIAHLLSDVCATLTGTVLVADGGYTL